jgi:hypothetical protein
VGCGRVAGLERARHWERRRYRRWALPVGKRFRVYILFDSRPDGFLVYGLPVEYGRTVKSGFTRLGAEFATHGSSW